ncbi:metallophosphoesterase [Halobacillus shinanisalinarum]|uniref:Metallophosphoesterase n=1 Tax=Halobacillus shinanisalinarum TaxID=2932258 RepID=A0ABY4H093_9BACI|nr:metallophosphoesterase [Halobacillus shinanisalinarum]UOQ93606.1 metallophosphoesterase [Halobacillus shinanisalinarum]
MRLIASVILVVVWLVIKMFRTAVSDKVSVHSLTVPIEKRYTIFFISDIHNRLINQQILATINDDIDAVIIGGDLADRRVSLRKLSANIKLLQTWDAPIYFIPGNNDHEFKSKPILSYLKYEGVEVLSNQSVNLNGKGLTLSGIDPYFSEPTIPACIPENSINILVVHEPSLLNEFSVDTYDPYDLILTGHTHGGQIRIFGQGPYSRGFWGKYHKAAFLNSEGYGTSLIPMRLGTTPEVHLIRLLPG